MKSCSLGMVFSLVALPLLAGATGTLTANGKTVKLTHAYAAKKKDPFDKKKQVNYVLLTDVEVPAAAVHDEGELMMFDMKNKLNYVSVLFDDEKNVNSVNVNSANLKVGHISGVGKQKLQITAIDAKHVVGRLYLEKPDDFFHDVYQYDVMFDAPFGTAPKEPGPESLKGTKLPPGGGEPGKAYLAYTKVVAGGDVKGVMKGSAAARAKEMQSDPDFKKLFPLLQAMQPKNIKVTGGAVDGDKATLMAEGKSGDAKQTGTIDMVREGGAWKVASESWKGKN